MKRRTWILGALALLVAAGTLIPTLGTAGDRRWDDDRDRIVVRSNGIVYHLDEDDLADLAEALQSLEIYLSDDFAFELEEILDDTVEMFDNGELEELIESTVESALAGLEDGYYDGRWERNWERRGDRLGRKAERWARDLERRLARQDFSALENLGENISRAIRDAQIQVYDDDRHRYRQRDRHRIRHRIKDSREDIEDRLDALHEEMEELRERLEELDEEGDI